MQERAYFAEQFKTAAMVQAMSSVYEAMSGRRCDARDLMREYQELLDWTSIAALERSIDLYQREFVDKFKNKKFVMHPDGATIEEARRENPQDGIKRLR